MSAHRRGRPEGASRPRTPTGCLKVAQRGAQGRERGAAPLDDTIRLGRALLSLASRAEQAAATKDLLSRLTPEALAGLHLYQMRHLTKRTTAVHDGSAPA